LSAQVVNFRVPRPVQFSRAVDTSHTGFSRTPFVVLAGAAAI